MNLQDAIQEVQRAHALHRALLQLEIHVKNTVKYMKRCPTLEQTIWALVEFQGALEDHETLRVVAIPLTGEMSEIWKPIRPCQYYIEIDK